MSPNVLKLQSTPDLFICLACGRRFATEQEAASGHLGIHSGKAISKTA